MGMVDRIVKAYVEKTASVTDTILEQMGGKGRLVRMLGAQLTRVDANTVGIAWPQRTRTRGNYVEVSYDSTWDWYTMTFYNRTATSSKVVKVYEEVYWDQLRSIFESQTGWVI